MPRRAPVVKILHPADQVKDVSVVRSVRMWDCGQYGYLWVHPSAVINILPGNGNINTTIQIPYREVVLVTVSRSGRLIEVEDGWLNSCVIPIFCVSPERVCDTYRPSYFSSRKQDFSRLFHACNLIPSYTFLKRSDHLSSLC